LLAEAYDDTEAAVKSSAKGKVFPLENHIVRNNHAICFNFKGPATKHFLEEINKTGLRMDQAYFYIGCDHPNSASFDLLRYGVKGVSTHFDILMKIIDGFYEEQDGDPEEEKIMRVRLTAAVTIIKRDQRNVLDEIAHQK